MADGGRACRASGSGRASPGEVTCQVSIPPPPRVGNKVVGEIGSRQFLRARWRVAAIGVVLACGSGRTAAQVTCEVPVEFSPCGGPATPVEVVTPGCLTIDLDPPVVDQSPCSEAQAAVRPTRLSCPIPDPDHEEYDLYGPDRDVYYDGHINWSVAPQVINGVRFITPGVRVARDGRIHVSPAAQPGGVLIQAEVDIPDTDLSGQQYILIKGSGGSGSGGCSSCGSAGGGHAVLSSAMMSFDLGSTVDGESAGALWFHETAFASAGANWDNLHWSVAKEIGTYRDWGGWQIFAPQALVQVRGIEDGYQIRYYRWTEVTGPIDGRYHLNPDDPNDRDDEYTVNAFLVWEVVGGNNDNDGSRLTVTKQTQNSQGDLVPVVVYVWNDFNNTYADPYWTLETKEPDGRVLRTEEVEKSATIAGLFTRTRHVHEGGAGGTLVYHEVEQWGREWIEAENADWDHLLSRTVDPSGSPQTTSFSYYPSNAAAGKALQVKLVTHADGSWEL